MLDGYFDLDGDTGVKVAKNRKRLLAVQAALEIAKNSVGNAHQAVYSRADDDLSNVAKEVANLADAIQAALEEDDEE
ncbi:hypothetical protein [Serratia sp. Nf2]|uniref:hypothetical protein n=1 Tax=Serratia sp. Nf2 TaxID=2116540 RepID=UPI000D17E2B3|nr:hypothetical protein [Serratia sp. Nf2]PTA75386.1 hypothetical protein C9411_20060 [Serratia sp. Nf2]